MWRTAPCPIDIVVPDRNQNQIRKPARSQQFSDLSGEIACPERAAEKILTAMFMIHERTKPRAFDRDKRRDCFEAFLNTAGVWSSVGVKKPILPARRVCAPQRAPRRRDVN